MATSPADALHRWFDTPAGTTRPLLVIAGPCVLEDDATNRQIGETVAAVCADLGLPYVFKASFDKANRSSIRSPRGPGMRKGLDLIAAMRDRLGVPATTDIHEPHHAEAAGKAVDLIQIPAFLCRQTDLLAAAAATGRAVNVKKGQFLAPWDMKPVLGKLTAAGCHNVLLCERGTFFGYGRLVNDMRALPQMRDFGVPVVFDATHSVQEPGGLGSRTGGNRAMVEPLARAATAIGIDGLFFETHPDPDRSPSDGPNMVPLDQFPALIARLLKIRQTVESFS